MAALRPSARISSNNGAARFHCQPFSKEMAALKLNKLKLQSVEANHVGRQGLPNQLPCLNVA
eukprot:8954332-Karenia_brevis.AAC.1